jgi:hypothetical protein
MGQFHPGDGPPNTIFRVWEPLAAAATHVPCGGARGGSWPERFPTGHERKASPLVRRRRLVSFINIDSGLSSAYGRSEIVPPMNRRNPAPRRMVRCYGSCCGTRGSDSPLNRLFCWPSRRTLPAGGSPIPCYWRRAKNRPGAPLWACWDEESTREPDEPKKTATERHPTLRGFASPWDTTGCHDLAYFTQVIRFVLDFWMCHRLLCNQHRQRGDRGPVSACGT